MRVQLDREKAEELFNKYQNVASSVCQLGAIVQNPDHANTQDLDEFLYISEQVRASISFLAESVSQLYQDAQSSKFYTVYQNNSGVILLRISTSLNTLSLRPEVGMSIGRGGTLLQKPIWNSAPVAAKGGMTGETMDTRSQ